MTGKRRTILAGMAAGALWAVAIVLLPAAPSARVFVPLNVAVILALAPGGAVMVAMVGRLAARRFFDDGIIDGEPFRPGSPAATDQNVLTNTVEQLVLAAALWPAIGMVLGGQVIIVMGLGFAFARIAFWAGYHLSPPLRAFGFAATFYPTVLACAWALLIWFV